MNELLNLAINATAKNVSTKKTSKKSVNDCLYEILFENDTKKTKSELIAEISLERLQAIHEKLDAKKFATEEVQSEFSKINVTVKNGFEAAICKGHTNASFNYNPKFDKYTFRKTSEFKNNESLFEVVLK